MAAALGAHALQKTRGLVRSLLTLWDDEWPPRCAGSGVLNARLTRHRVTVPGTRIGRQDKRTIKVEAFHGFSW